MIIRKVTITHESSPEIPDNGDDSSKRVMTRDFFKYVSKNGYHFTPDLADSIPGTWKCNQIKDELGETLIGNIEPITLGDITYYSNFIYSKFFPNVILRDKDCVKTAFRILKEYSYPEASFHHFISDLIGEGKTLDWGSYL